MADALVAAIRAALTREQVVELPGPVRPLAVGPETAARLLAGTASTPLAESAREIHALLQEPEARGYYAAMPLLVLRDAPFMAGADPAERFTVCALARGVRTLLPVTRSVRLVSFRDRLRQVGFEALIAIAGASLRPHDERHVLVEALDGPDWERLEARAAEHEEHRFASLPVSPPPAPPVGLWGTVARMLRPTPRIPGLPEAAAQRVARAAEERYGPLESRAGRQAWDRIVREWAALEARP